MRWQTLIVSCLAGAIASLTLPPIGLVPAALALAYPALKLARAKGRSEAAWIAAAMGMGWFTASTHWIAHSLLVGEAEFWFFTPLVALGIPAILALFWLVAGALAWQFGKGAAGRLGWVVVMLGLAELARGHLATGFPWNAPGYLFSAHLWLLQSASWFGLYGLTLIAVCFALAPAFWKLDHKRIAAAFLVIPLVLAGLGAARLSQTAIDDSQTVRHIRLVQPAIAQAEKWDRSKRGQHFTQIIRVSTDQKPVPKLMVWPETAFSAFPGREPGLLQIMASQSLPFDGHLITGLPRLDDQGRMFNAAALVDPSGQILATYDKQRLVPFGEFAPLRRFLPFVDIIAGPKDFSAGEPGQLFAVPGYGTVRMLICYESIFSGGIIQNGVRPDLIINITNDAWFGRTLGPWQHLAQARMRAVEEGIPLIRVANTGVSSGFDSWGRVLGQIGLNEMGAIDLAVPAAAPPTVFSKWSHAIFFAVLIMLAWLARRLDLSSPIRH